MNTRGTEIVLNILIFISILALLFVVGYPQYKEAQPSKVKIGVDKSFGALPFYVAKFDTTRRYYQLEKLIPEFIEINDNPLEGIKNGAYDIAAVPWYLLIISPSYDGDTVRAFSSVDFKRVPDAIVISKKSKIKNLKGLEGKRLGYLTNDEYLVNLFLSDLEQEYRIKKLTKVFLQPYELTTAIIENKVDALYIVDPYLSYRLYEGDTILVEGLFTMFSRLSTLPYMAIVMRKSFVKNNTGAAIRLKNAIEATIGYLQVHPEVGKNTLLKINDWPSEPTLILYLRMPEYQRLSQVDLKAIENLQSLLVRKGISTCGIKPSEFLFEKSNFIK